jgi:ribosome modulation factor
MKLAADPEYDNLSIDELNERCKLPNALLQPEEYVEGMMARREGKNVDTCPYESSCGINNKRIHWLTGYYHERIRHLIEKPMEKYNVEV